jgi:hypothetical protein
MLLLEIALVLNAGFATWLMVTFKPVEVTQ